MKTTDVPPGGEAPANQNPVDPLQSKPEERVFTRKEKVFIQGLIELGFATDSFENFESLKPYALPQNAWDFIKPMNEESHILRPESLLEEKAVGSLLGLAVGDALGVSNEIFDPELVAVQRDFLRDHPLQRMVGLGPWVSRGVVLEPGEFTDDTSMALCLADSILSYRPLLEGYDQEEVSNFARDLMLRFTFWWRYGYNAPRYQRLVKNGVYFRGMGWGLGGNTARALRQFAFTGFQNPWVGGTDPNTDSGNGAIMRLAPVALYWHDHQPKAVELARLQTKVTHNTQEAVDASAYLASIIVKTLQGAPRTKIFSGEGVKLHHPEIVELASRRISQWRKIPEEKIRTLPGRALWTLEAALWCIHTTDTFEEAVLKAVNLGGDADTVAAVTGQLAGALYGVRSIPERWISPLKFRDQIEKRAIALVRRSNFTRDMMLTYPHP